MVSVYLDASVLVALFSTDTFTGRARAFLRSRLPFLVVSDFAAAEFASAIARQVRTRQTTEGIARMAFTDFDSWTATEAGRTAVVPADVALAGSFLRRLNLPLRTADALNIAIAVRLGASLASFDVKMQVCAEALGLSMEKL